MLAAFGGLCGRGRGLESRVGGSEDAGGTPALPVWIPACAGKTKTGRCKLFSLQLAMPVATDTMEDENGGDLWRERGCGRDARAPSLDPRSPIGVGDRLRGDDEKRGTARDRRV